MRFLTLRNLNPKDEKMLKFQCFNGLKNEMKILCLKIETLENEIRFFPFINDYGDEMKNGTKCKSSKKKKNLTCGSQVYFYMLYTILIIYINSIKPFNRNDTYHKIIIHRIINFK